jgi:hypothetical protein
VNKTYGEKRPVSHLMFWRGPCCVIAWIRVGMFRCQRASDRGARQTPSDTGPETG